MVNTGQKQPTLAENSHPCPEIRIIGHFGYFGPFLAQKWPFSGPFYTLHMSQKMFLAPTGASYSIAKRKHIFGKQEQTKLGKKHQKAQKKLKKSKNPKKKKNIAKATKKISPRPLVPF
jgi:hypothetical protein